jgi:hypothetical protein
MPRPLVEVRQTVLNPVVTINDPTQEVCIIGLHTDDYTDKLVNTLDRPGSVAAGADVHIGSAAEHSFTIDADGVFIDAAVDFGPDAYDISGDHTLKFSEAYVSAHDIAGGAYNSNDALDDIDTNLLTFAAVGNLAATLSGAGEGNSVVVTQPVGTHCNKLTWYSGDAVNFNTEATYFEGLNVGSEIKFQDVNAAVKTFVILRKDADAIYLRGKTADDHAQLVAHTNFQLEDGSGAISTISDINFQLEHPGIHESVVRTTTINDETLILVDSLPFVIRESNILHLQATLLTKVPEADLSALKVSETDVANPLAIAVETDGDAVITVPLARMVKGGKDIVRAKFTMSYTVAKTSQSAAVVPVNANTRATVLGESSPRNPLSLAAQVALGNSGGGQVSVLALDISPPDGETAVRSVETAFADALTILNRHSTVYAMVPLTINDTVTKSYANAAEAMSAPAKGKFRICLGSSKGAPTHDYIIGSEASPAKLGVNTLAGLVHTLTNTAQDKYRMPANKVLEGDLIVATDASNAYTGKVTGVTNTALTITWDTAATPAGTVTLTGYYIARSLGASSKISRQIEILAAQSKALASKRLFLTFPGACTVVDGDLNYVGVPSYYVTAAFAGMLTRLDIHRPKNFLGLNDIAGLQDFSRFSDDQLDQISDAGYLVFQQDEAISAPYCVHQVNSFHGTQAGTQEFTELSVLANFDFVSRYMKEVLDPFAGTVNIVPTTLSLIRASLDAAIDNLKARKVATIGAPLLSASIQHVRQASYDQGTVEASMLVSLPKVLNKITLEVVSG